MQNKNTTVLKCEEHRVRRELINALGAIGVVAKRLAERLSVFDADFNISAQGVKSNER